MNIFKRTIKEAEELDKTIESFKETPGPEEEWIWVEGYKGTDKDMKCRAFQYELGVQYDMPSDAKIEECKTGFHLCLNLKDVFGHYYIGNGNRFFKVKALVRKADNNEYGSDILKKDCYGFNMCVGKYDKLAAKSIIFLSELTADEILKGTDAENLDDKYKQLALDISVDAGTSMYKIDTLIADGYSEAFAQYMVNANNFNVAHAVGSQKDLSMDIKVLSILFSK